MGGKVGHERRAREHNRVVADCERQDNEQEVQVSEQRLAVRRGPRRDRKREEQEETGAVEREGDVGLCVSGEWACRWWRPLPS